MPLALTPLQHPQRVLLHNEIHARPPESMAAPLAISHIVMLADAAGREASRAHLAALLRERHLALPDAHTTHLRMDLGAFRIRWELHTEFVTWTFMVPMQAEGFGAREPVSATAAVPREWLAALPGQCLCSLNLWVLCTEGFGAGALVPHVLHEDTLVASTVAGGHGEVYTDFALHPDGSSRMVLLAGRMAPRRLGRLVQRLLEVETYRMAALLGLPAARGAAAELASAERELAALADAIRTADRHAEPALLDRLTRLAGQVESQYAATHSRFSASKAYFELVDLRIADLAESRLAGLQTIREFMDRRLSPRAQHLRMGGAAPGGAVAARLAHEQPAAHARRDRAAAKQPGAAGHHEPAPGAAAAAAVHRRGAVGGGHHLLHRRAGELPGQGRAAAGLAAGAGDHGRHRHSGGGARRVGVAAPAAPAHVPSGCVSAAPPRRCPPSPFRSKYQKCLQPKPVKRQKLAKT